VTEAQVRKARRAYLGAVSYVDDQLDRLMQALSASGLAADTIVILTSDHGEMLGERGLWYKMSFFEGASRAPLVVASPGRFAPARVGASVSLVDASRLCGGRRCGARGFDRRAEPWLASRRRAGHDEAIGEYLAEGAIAPLMVIRRGAFKFIHCPADPDQLHRIAAFRAEVAERWDLAALDAQVRQSQRRRRLVDAAWPRARSTPGFSSRSATLPPICPRQRGPRRPRGDDALSAGGGRLA
jgi:choline-sulfatase